MVMPHYSVVHGFAYPQELSVQLQQAWNKYIKISHIHIPQGLNMQAPRKATAWYSFAVLVSKQYNMMDWHKI